SGSTPAKTANCWGVTASPIGPGGQTAPSSPTARATIAAVAGASPVTITVRTPKVRISVTNAAESARGGSLSAISPAKRIDAAAPVATASSRKPFAWSSLAAADNAGIGGARPITEAYAPFTIRSVPPPLGSAAVASEVFLAGSKGTNLISFGSLAPLLEAAARVAASTGSCPPSALATAASPSKAASSKPGAGWTAVTDNALS